MITNISKLSTFGSLIVHQDEIVGLAWLLGSGRTGTASMIFGADRPVSGKLSFKDQIGAFHQPAQTVDAGVGHCTEDRKAEGIVPGLSVRENLTPVLLPPHPARCDPARGGKRFGGWLNRQAGHQD